MIHPRPLLLCAALLAASACADQLNGSTAPAVAIAASQSVLDTVTVSDISAPADGATLVTVAARVRGGDLSPPLAVTLTTTGGAFVANATNTISLVPGDSGWVRTTLRVPKEPGALFIRAYFAGSSKARELTLTRAFPQQLLLSAAVVGVTSGAKNSLTITATAARYPGWVSRGIPVAFSLERIGLAGAPAGSLDGPVVTDTLGNATIHYSPGNAIAPDSVLLSASVPSGNASAAIVTTIKLYITPPTP